jgi:hypothetical protein
MTIRESNERIIRHGCWLLGAAAMVVVMVSWAILTIFGLTQDWFPTLLEGIAVALFYSVSSRA